MTEDQPVLLGSKAAATTHPAEPRATLAAWMLLGDAQNGTQRSAEGEECVTAYDEWAADLDRRLARSERRRKRWARIFQWGRK